MVGRAPEGGVEDAGLALDAVIEGGDNHLRARSLVSERKDARWSSRVALP